MSVDRDDDRDGRLSITDTRGARETNGIIPDRQIPPDRPPGADPGARADWPAGADSQTRADRSADYQARVDAAYRAHAIDQGCARVRETEQTTVTPALCHIESQDPTRHLAGLEFRLKDTDRLTEKVTGWMAADASLTPSDAFGQLKDAIRYTFAYSDDNYTNGVRADVDRLKTAGFEPIDLRNSWANDEYRGINSWWRAPDKGQVFEVQFHTQASFEAKQATHAAYEKIRDPATSQSEREEMQDFQRRVTAGIPVPRDAGSISIR